MFSGNTGTLSTTLLQGATFGPMSLAFTQLRRTGGDDFGWNWDYRLDRFGYLAAPAVRSLTRIIVSKRSLPTDPYFASLRMS
jgi:hypothetical protein